MQEINFNLGGFKIFWEKTNKSFNAFAILVPWEIEANEKDDGKDSKNIYGKCSTQVCCQLKVSINFKKSNVFGDLL